ncbi:MAG: STAS domain-containing protein [Xanthomonadales bacterium]|nr:STAS domain-containing protein [Xanthomonadales bacterium]
MRPAEPDRTLSLAGDAAAGMLALGGSLVFSSAGDSLRRLVAALPPAGSVAVDLSGISESDSAGLATLVEWRAQALRRGLHLRLAGAPEGLRALARLSDIDADLFD